MVTLAKSSHLMDLIRQRQVIVTISWCPTNFRSRLTRHSKKSSYRYAVSPPKSRPRPTKATQRCTTDTNSSTSACSGQDLFRMDQKLCLTQAQLKIQREDQWERLHQEQPGIRALPQIISTKKQAESYSHLRRACLEQRLKQQASLVLILESNPYLDSNEIICNSYQLLKCISSYCRNY